MLILHLNEMFINIFENMYILSTIFNWTLIEQHADSPPPPPPPDTPPSPQTASPSPPQSTRNHTPGNTAPWPRAGCRSARRTGARWCRHGTRRSSDASLNLRSHADGRPANPARGPVARPASLRPVARRLGSGSSVSVTLGTRPRRAR